MIVVDSSAFIEFYRPAGSPEVSSAVADAIMQDQVAVNGLIQVEIVGYAPQTARESLISDFKAFHWLRLRRTDFDLAQEIGSQLRDTGITVPATDLIIAASAIRCQATLYHLDRHFDQIASQTKLQVRSFL